VADLVIYTVPTCATCARAVRDLTADGVDFEERDIRKNDQWLEEASKLSISVPILVRGSRIEIGWKGDMGCPFQ
jgi:glutaredoxin